MSRNGKIVEITGAPGSGKTAFIRSRFDERNVLLGGLPLSYGVVRRIYWSAFLFFYAFAVGSVTLRQGWWLLKRAAGYDETLFARINAFRNCMMKFGSGFFKPRDEIPVVDEGISHIPFLLGLNDADIDKFISLFHGNLEQVDILFVDTPARAVLEERIIARGHKRVRDPGAVDGFVNKNIKIAEYYKRALVDAGFHVTVVSADFSIASPGDCDSG